jgi:predicted nuclease of predicted toxin-antitoxin system
VKFLADENVYAPIIRYLRSVGHEVLDIRETPHSGASDDEIFRKAVEEKLTILTMDKDFVRMLRFPPDQCHGIIVVKLYKMSVDETTEIFKRCFESLSHDDIAGKLFIITRDGVRTRTPKRIGS